MKEKLSFKTFIWLVLFLLTNLLIFINLLNYNSSWDLLWKDWKCKHINNVLMLEKGKSNFNFALVNIIKDNWENQYHYIWLYPNWDVFDESYYLKWNIKKEIISPFENEKVEILYYQYKDNNWKFNYYEKNIWFWITGLYWMNIHNFVYYLMNKLK